MPRGFRIARPPAGAASLCGPRRRPARSPRVADEGPHLPVVCLHDRRAGAGHVLAPRAGRIPVGCPAAVWRSAPRLGQRIQTARGWPDGGPSGRPNRRCTAGATAASRPTDRQAGRGGAWAEQAAGTACQCSACRSRRGGGRMPPARGRRRDARRFLPGGDGRGRTVASGLPGGRPRRPPRRWRHWQPRSSRWRERLAARPDAAASIVRGTEPVRADCDSLPGDACCEQFRTCTPAWISPSHAPRVPGGGPLRPPCRPVAAGRGRRRTRRPRSRWPRPESRSCARRRAFAAPTNWPGWRPPCFSPGSRSPPGGWPNSPDCRTEPGPGRCCGSSAAPGCRRFGDPGGTDCRRLSTALAGRLRPLDPPASGPSIRSPVSRRPASRRWRSWPIVSRSPGPKSRRFGASGARKCSANSSSGTWWPSGAGPRISAGHTSTSRRGGFSGRLRAPAARGSASDRGPSAGSPEQPSADWASPAETWSDGPACNPAEMRPPLARHGATGQFFGTGRSDVLRKQVLVSVEPFG